MLKNFAVTSVFATRTVAKDVLLAAFGPSGDKGVAKATHGGSYWPFPDDWGDDDS